MKYYIVKQDRKLPGLVGIKGMPECPEVQLKKAEEARYKECTNIYVTGSKSSIYPDLFQAPVLLASEKIKEIFEWYEDTIIYKLVVLTDLEESRQEVYRLVLPDILDAVSEKSEFYDNGTPKKVILEKEKVGDYRVFQVEVAKKTYLIMDEDVVESILKRDYMGILFEEVEAV